MASQPTESIASEFLARAHTPDTATSILRERVKNRPLLLRPSSPDPKRDTRSKRQYERYQKAKKQRKSNKPQPLSAKRKRALGVYEIPKCEQKYTIYKPLHRMWCAYMREVLGLSTQGGESGRTYVNAAVAGPILVSADYHGALFEVVRSRCVSRVGLEGIVVRDTKFTFELVTERDVVKVVPKEHSVFRFEVPFESPVEEDKGEEMEEGGQVDRVVGEGMEVKKPLVFEIHGSSFEIRAPERANKKFRPHLAPDL